MTTTKTTLVKTETTVKVETEPGRLPSTSGGGGSKSIKKELIVDEVLGSALEYVADAKLGQKKPTPSPGSGTRVFYESLLKQNPDSFMALKWCVENGVYPEGWEPVTANKMLEDKKAHIKRHGSASFSPANKKARKSRGLKKTKIIDNTTVDRDTGSLAVGGWETANSREI